MAATTAVTACTGAIGDAPADLTPAAVEAPLFAAPAGLRRLTRTQFANTLTDLLHVTPDVSKLEKDSAVSGFLSIGASRLALSPSGVDAYEVAVADTVAKAFTADTAFNQILGCKPASASDGCFDRAIETFGRRAWRRTLDDDEVARYVDVARAAAAAGSSPSNALLYAIRGLLASPSFIYRVEIGGDVPGPQSSVALTSQEIAVRLAYLIWASTPDDTLLDAAEADALTTADAIRAQASRLLADPRARRGVSAFADEYYRLYQLETITKDATLFPQYSSAFAPAMRAEVEARVLDVVFDRPADFLSLYDSTTVFVDKDLAALYGMPARTNTTIERDVVPSEWVRRGLMTSLGILTILSTQQRTSPTARGKFISEALLCKEIPPPPPNVDVISDDAASAGLTRRQQMEAHRSKPQCAGCHSVMDPAGFSLENFDAIGVFRATEHDITIDTSGDLDGVHFASYQEFATALRAHPNAGSCVARKLYEFAIGHAEADAELDEIDRLAARFTESGNRFDELILDVVTADGFRFAGPPDLNAPPRTP